LAQRQTGSQGEKKVHFSMYVFFILYILVFPAIPFLTAGTFRWSEAWWYYGASIAATVISRLIVLRINPDQLRERGTSPQAENVMPWDRLLSNLVGLVLPVITLVVIGLDHRWSWTPELPSWVAPVSFVAMLAGYALATWAFVVNRFFSGVVRIQDDRGHEVVTDGPYRFVRHPGYLGGLLSFFATPLLLGSLWGFVPVALYFAALVTRTELEDRTLRELLSGYREYSKHTRFKLLPGIW
jgi:protein-S-isoprenylcysteine O-methyltransferase Ste14